MSVSCLFVFVFVSSVSYLGVIWVAYLQLCCLVGILLASLLLACLVGCLLVEDACQDDLCDTFGRTSAASCVDPSQLL